MIQNAIRSQLISHRCGSVYGIFLAALFAIADSAAAAIIDPVSQDRRISAAAEETDAGGSTEDSESASAPGFAEFDESVSAAVGEASASADQRSGFGELSTGELHIFATGDAAAQIGPGFFASADASTHFELTFDLLVPVEYFLNGSLLMGGEEGSSRFLMTGPSGVIHDERVSNPAFPDLFLNELGTLLPGRYTVLAEGRAPCCFSFDLSSAGSYAIDLFLLPVPEPSTLLLSAVALAALLGQRARARGSCRQRIT